MDRINNALETIERLIVIAAYMMVLKILAKAAGSTEVIFKILEG